MQTSTLLTNLKLTNFSLLKMVFETSKRRVTFLSLICLIKFFRKQLTVGSLNINHHLNFKKRTHTHTHKELGPVPQKMIKFNPGLKTNFNQGFLVYEHVTRAHKMLLCLYSEIQ